MTDPGRGVDAALLHALGDVGRALTGDVRVVVLRSEGPDFGGPPAGAAGSLPGGAGCLPDGVEALGWLSGPALVSVAAVQGVAEGAALELALACDLRVAAQDAVLSLPQVGSGVVPHLGGTGRLAALLGPARALELCLTGRRVAASEAQQWGLVNAVVPRGELAAATRDLAGALLAAPRAAAAEVKALVRGAGSRTPAEQCEAEREAQARCLRDLAGAGE
jgi:hypothetical protein